MAVAPGEEADLYLASVTTAEPALLDALLHDRELDLGCRPLLRRTPDGQVQLDLFAPEQKLAELRAVSGLEVRISHNASAEGRARQQEVGTGDRFEGGRIPPEGLGRKLRSTGPDESTPPV